MAILKCTKKDIEEFKENYHSLFYHKPQYENIASGKSLPADYKDMIKRAEKVYKSLLKFDWTSEKEK